MDDGAAKSLRQRESTEDAPDLDQSARIYSTPPAGQKGTQADTDADNLKRHSEKGWREKQQGYRRYGRFNEQHRTSSTVTVTRGVMLPAHFSQHKAEVNNVMSRIEEHGDGSAKEFKEALQASTVKIEDREELKRMADRREKSLDKLKEEYKNDNFPYAQEGLRRALESGAAPD